MNILNKTRKFSCVNTRGILLAAYQVLHLLSYPGGRGGGTPSLAGGGYSIPDQGVGGPDLAGEYPILGRDLGPVIGVPPGKDMGPVEVLWDGDGLPPQKGHGTSGSIMGWRWATPMGVNWQTETITFPIFWMRAVKITWITSSVCSLISLE